MVAAGVRIAHALDHAQPTFFEKPGRGLWGSLDQQGREAMENIRRSIRAAQPGILDVAVVGAPEWDRESGLNEGAVYIFERNAGGTDNWGQVATLTAADAGIYAARVSDADGFMWSADARLTVVSTNKSGTFLIVK